MKKPKKKLKRWWRQLRSNKKKNSKNKPMTPTQIVVGIMSSEFLDITTLIFGKVNSID